MPSLQGHRRRAWHACHKWLGLSLGVLFALLGLTGSLLVFYQELDDGFRDASSVPPWSPSAVVAALQLAEPGRSGTWRIEAPSLRGAPVTARYMKPVETAGESFAPLIVRLHPQTLAVSDRHFWGEDFWSWIYDLHYSLLLGDSGKTLLGIGGGLLLLLIGSGLYLWWPARGQWRPALAIKSGAVWKRRVYDLHVKPGVYIAAVMIVVVATGLVLAVPAWFKPGIGWFSPLTAAVRPAGSLPVNSPFIAAEVAMVAAQAHFPDAQVRWLETPTLTVPVWRIQMRQAGEVNRRFPRSQVWVDAQTAAVIAVREPGQNSTGDSIFDWLHPLHNGEAFGLAGRIVVCALGLLPLLAFVTGLIRWRHKLRSVASKPAKKAV